MARVGFDYNSALPGDVLIVRDGDWRELKARVSMLSRRLD